MEYRIFDVNQDELARKGKKIYDEVLRDKLEPTHRGEIVAINTETGDYFLGRSILEAVRKGREKFPGCVDHRVQVLCVNVRKNDGSLVRDG